MQRSTNSTIPSPHKTLFGSSTRPIWRSRFALVRSIGWLVGICCLSFVLVGASKQPPPEPPTTTEQIANMSLVDLNRWSRHLWQETKALEQRWRGIFTRSNANIQACLKPHFLQLRKSRYRITLVWRNVRRFVAAEREEQAKTSYTKMVQLWKQAQTSVTQATACIPKPSKDTKPSTKTTEPSSADHTAVAKPKPVATPQPRVKRPDRPADAAPAEPAPAPSQDPAAPPPPPTTAAEPPRLVVVKKRKLTSRHRSAGDADDSSVARNMMRPGAAAHGFAGRQGEAGGRRALNEESQGIILRSAIGGKKGKKDTDKRKPKVQVWQRTQSNTTLSKVSVGGGKFLILKKLRVSAQVEGMRVRTIIDHIYYNPFDRTLEGNFKYTLPPDASVSYYAMFVGERPQRTPNFFSGKAPSVTNLLQMKPQQIARTAPDTSWGRLREARLVPAEQGRQVYEDITRQRIDPALLEQDAPNTFAGRVFPIPAKGYNRVILAYEETLPQIQGQHVYRFRFAPDVADMIDFSVGYNASYSELQGTNLKKQRCQFPKNQSMVRCYWEQNMPKNDAVFYFLPKQPHISWMAGIDPIDSRQYLLAQARIQLPSATTYKGSSRAIFMLDTSLSAQPDLFAAHVSLLQKILEKNAHIQKFNILFFDVSASWANTKGWIANTPSERKNLLSKLQHIVLEGATDLAAAMNALAHPPWFSKQQADSSELDVFFLSDGQLNWGNLHVDKILHQFQQEKPWKQVRFLAYQLGIGSENLGLLRRLVRQGGSIFPCLGQAELDRCATAHNQSSMLLERVEIEGISASQILVAGRQTNVYSDGLITVAAQFVGKGNATLHLIGQYQGKPFRQTHALNVTAQGDLGPRAWAEMAIAQLLELDDPKLRKLIVAYSQHFHIPNQYCSFLILETDKEYKQYGLEQERQAQKVSDLSQFLLRLWQEKSAHVTERQRWITLLRRSLKQFKALQQSSGRTALSLLHALPDSDYQFATQDQGEPWLVSAVPAGYLDSRLKSTDHFSPFVTEAQRRLEQGISGAVRSLSSIVELHPANPQALRLVGYYLRAWNRPDLAVRVFFRVLEQRPFEPHAYRDVAISLMRMKRYGLASAMYEVMLAGQWHSRFGSFKRLAHEEYALLLYDAFQQKNLLPTVQSQLEQRQSMLGLQVKKAGLRVTVTWNTDNTDIDLWVTGPQGHRCYYRNKSTPDGGQLLEDITRGYGPERYENQQPPAGKYVVELQYYGHQSNVFGNETHVSVILVQNAGTPQQSIVFKNLVLRQRKQIVRVTELKI